MHKKPFAFLAVIVMIAQLLVIIILIKRQDSDFVKIADANGALVTRNSSSPLPTASLDQFPQSNETPHVRKALLTNVASMISSPLLQDHENGEVKLSGELCSKLKLTAKAKVALENMVSSHLKLYNDQVIHNARFVSNENGDFFSIPAFADFQSRRKDLENRLAGEVGEDLANVLMTVADNDPHFGMFGQYPQEIYFDEYKDAGNNSDKIRFSLATKILHGKNYIPDTFFLEPEKAQNNPIFQGLTNKFSADISQDSR